MFSVPTFCLKGLVSMGGRRPDRGGDVRLVWCVSVCVCACWCVFQFSVQAYTFIFYGKFH